MKTNKTVVFVHLQTAETALPSLTASFIHGQDITPEEEDMVKWAALTLYAGGIETVRFRPKSVSGDLIENLSF
jgi:hypothetical protein